MQTINAAISFIAEYYSLFWIVSALMLTSACIGTVMCWAMKMSFRIHFTVFGILMIFSSTMVTHEGSPTGMLLMLFAMTVYCTSVFLVLLLIAISRK